MSTRTPLRHGLAALVTVLVIGIADRWYLRSQSPDTLPDTVWLEPVERPLHGWNTRNARDEPVDERLFLGKWSLVFVGYTSCPDVCPTTLAAIAEEAQELSDVQRVFVAVDTPDDLKGYVAFFDPALIGLQASGPDLEHLLSQLGATARKRPDGGFDHSTSAFVVDPDARVVAHVLHPTRGGVAAAVAAIRNQWSPVLPHDLHNPPRPGDLGVVYGTLHNPTEVPIVLTGVHSPDYAGATFHETIQDGPISRMRAIDELAILPGEELAFVPGGHHVMLHGRTREAGAVLLRLDTRDGRTLQVSTDPP